MLSCVCAGQRTLAEMDNLPCVRIAGQLTGCSRRLHRVFAALTQICPHDVICSSCQSPWHMKHLERQNTASKVGITIPPKRSRSNGHQEQGFWECPRCAKTCCCQIECTLEAISDGHRCCHLRRKQLKERRYGHR